MALCLADSLLAAPVSLFGGNACPKRLNLPRKIYSDRRRWWLAYPRARLLALARLRLHKEINNSVSPLRCRRT
ncbi:hypothetical protein M3N55_16465 [Roseibaca sp. V10]|uniref:Secreted protein n=2 Tax=Roseinatronobacter domitianus TaxID=2940293 RepID=A0ABT0M604_9RHOB|nr:hypothetical protein [Roseibaca domitiana]